MGVIPFIFPDFLGDQERAKVLALELTDAELSEGAAEIEFLATAPEARGKGGTKT